MNHAQARGQSAHAAAVQAVLQFLNESGYAATAAQLENEAEVEYDEDALANHPGRLLTALSSYEDARGGAFKKRQADPEIQTVTRWMGSLRESSAPYASSPLLSLQTHKANVICCKFQPPRGDGAAEGSRVLFAAGSADKAVAICELSDEAEAVVLRRAQASGPVLSLHFNPVRPELLLATCMNGGHSVINVEASEQDADDAAAAEAAGEVVQLHSAIDHKKFVVVGRWSPDGRHYATGSHDGSVNVYAAAAAAAAAAAGTDDAKAGSGGVVWQRVARFDFTGPVIGDGSNDVYVEALEWLDERNFVVSLREDNYLHVLTLQDDADAATAAAASASASGVESDAVLSRGLKETHRVNVNETGDDHVSFTILDMKLSPNGLGLLCATDRHRVILLARPHTTARNNAGASSSSSSSSTTTAATVVSRGVHVRNFYSSIVADGYSTPRLAWSPCGRWAYVTSQDRAVVVLEVPSGRSVHRITGHQVNVRDVATHPVTGQVLTCSFDKSCRVWNPAADKQAHAAGSAAASASASS